MGLVVHLDFYGNDNRVFLIELLEPPENLLRYLH